MDIILNPSSKLAGFCLICTSSFVFSSSACPYTGYPCNDYVRSVSTLHTFMHRECSRQASSMANAQAVQHLVVLKWVGHWFRPRSGSQIFLLFPSGFHSIYSPGRGNLYLTTRDTSPFCGLFEDSIEASPAVVFDP